MKNKKYLVTGGAGFIGSSVVESLLKKGHKVKVLDNLIRSKNSRLKNMLNDIEFVNGDIRDKDLVLSECSGMDGVIHLAYLNGTEHFYSKPELVLDIGVKGMINIIDACIKNNVYEFFLASSSEVYQNPETIPTPEDVVLKVPDIKNPRYSYGGGKIISELMAINYGKKYFEKTIIFRPHNVYGPNMGWEHVIPQFIEKINKSLSKNNKILDLKIQGTGEETRAFVFIKDFVDGLIKIIEKGKNLTVYNIGTNDEIKVSELARLIAKLQNLQLNILPGQLNEGSTKRRCPDIKKLCDLGYKPSISLSEGLKITIDWYLKNLRN